MHTRCYIKRRISYVCEKVLHAMYNVHICAILLLWISLAYCKDVWICKAHTYLKVAADKLSISGASLINHIPSSSSHAYSILLSCHFYLLPVTICFQVTADCKYWSFIFYLSFCVSCYSVTSYANMVTRKINHKTSCQNPCWSYVCRIRHHLCR